MQTQQHIEAPYSGAIARNIAAEMADHARERGEGLTHAEYKRLGFTDDQIERNAHAAARLYARSSIGRHG